jgi:hypothetical protein
MGSRWGRPTAESLGEAKWLTFKTSTVRDPWCPEPSLTLKFETKKEGDHQYQAMVINHLPRQFPAAAL